MLDKKLLSSYLQLPQPENKVQCMYVWIDGSLRNLRCKTRTMGKKPASTSDLPRWEFCGSATELDVSDIADVYAQPAALYRDPFRTEKNRLVLCETYTRDGIPTFANNRQRLLSVVQKIKEKKMQIEIYQPFSLRWQDGKPLCLKDSPCISLLGNGLFCGKAVPEALYRACLYAGVNVRSLEASDSSGKWKYSIESDEAVKVGDELWISRYILRRVAEDFGVVVCFDTSEASSLVLSGEEIVKGEKQRLTDALSSKFTTKDETAVRVSSTSSSILLSGINPESDPYSIITKVLEVFPVN